MGCVTKSLGYLFFIILGIHLIFADLTSEYDAINIMFFYLIKNNI